MVFRFEAGHILIAGMVCLQAMIPEFTMQRRKAKRIVRHWESGALRWRNWQRLLLQRLQQPAQIAARARRVLPHACFLPQQARHMPRSSCWPRMQLGYEELSRLCSNPRTPVRPCAGASACSCACKLEPTWTFDTCASTGLLSAGGADAEGTEYAGALAQATFCAIADALDDMAAVFDKDAPELSSILVCWALQVGFA